MTVEELVQSARPRQSREWMLGVLKDWRERGIVEEHEPGRWRMTESGFRDYGRHLLAADRREDRTNGRWRPVNASRFVADRRQTATNGDGDA